MSTQRNGSYDGRYMRSMSAFRFMQQTFQKLLLACIAFVYLVFESRKIFRK